MPTHPIRTTPTKSLQGISVSRFHKQDLVHQVVHNSVTKTFSRLLKKFGRRHCFCPQKYNLIGWFSLVEGFEESRSPSTPCLFEPWLFTFHAIAAVYRQSFGVAVLAIDYCLLRRCCQSRSGSWMFLVLDLHTGRSISKSSPFLPPTMKTSSTTFTTFFLHYATTYKSLL